MQEGDLPLLFAQDEEHGVEQFREFGDVVQPNSARHLWKT